MEARLHRFIYLEEASLMDERLIGPLRLRNTATLIPGILSAYAWLATHSAGFLALSALLLLITAASITHPRRSMRLEGLIAAYIYTLTVILLQQGDNISRAGHSSRVDESIEAEDPGLEKHTGVGGDPNGFSREERGCSMADTRSVHTDSACSRIGNRGGRSPPLRGGVHRQAFDT
ncbi:hypothetical protein [Desulfurococcus mucosus]|uniref:hypothetical protein n=1 Tax=Desulfurococcus mucosus TaxID=2275 RepID=UPI000B0CAEF5|nr:hypothetical protein [Desulfurococcus mucosus]